MPIRRESRHPYCSQFHESGCSLVRVVHLWRDKWTALSGPLSTVEWILPNHPPWFRRGPAHAVLSCSATEEVVERALPFAGGTEPLHPEPDTRDPKPEIRNQEPGTRNPKPETRNPAGGKEAAMQSKLAYSKGVSSQIETQRQKSTFSRLLKRRPLQRRQHLTTVCCCTVNTYIYIYISIYIYIYNKNLLCCRREGGGDAGQAGEYKGRLLTDRGPLRRRRRTLQVRVRHPSNRG